MSELMTMRETDRRQIDGINVWRGRGR